MMGDDNLSTNEIKEILSESIRMFRFDTELRSMIVKSLKEIEDGKHVLLEEFFYKRAMSSFEDYILSEVYNLRDKSMSRVKDMISDRVLTLCMDKTGTFEKHIKMDIQKYLRDKKLENLLNNKE